MILIVLYLKKYFDTLASNNARKGYEKDMAATEKALEYKYKLKEKAETERIESFKEFHKDCSDAVISFNQEEIDLSYSDEIVTDKIFKEKVKAFRIKLDSAKHRHNLNGRGTNLEKPSDDLYMAVTGYIKAIALARPLVAIAKREYDKFIIDNPDIESGNNDIFDFDSLQESMKKEYLNFRANKIDKLKNHLNNMIVYLENLKEGDNYLYVIKCLKNYELNYDNYIQFTTNRLG